MASSHPMPNVWYRTRLYDVGDTLVRLDPWPTYAIAAFESIDLDLHNTCDEDIVALLDGAPPLTTFVPDEHDPDRARCVPDRARMEDAMHDPDEWWVGEPPDGWPLNRRTPPAGLEVNDHGNVTAKLALHGVCVAQASMTRALARATAHYPRWPLVDDIDLDGPGDDTGDPCVRHTAPCPEEATPAATLWALEQIAVKAQRCEEWRDACGEDPHAPIPAARWVVGLEFVEAQTHADTAWTTLEEVLSKDGHRALSLHKASATTLAWGLDRGLPSNGAAWYEWIEGVEAIVQPLGATRTLWAMV